MYVKNVRKIRFRVFFDKSSKVMYYPFSSDAAKNTVPLEKCYNIPEALDCRDVFLHRPWHE